MDSSKLHKQNKKSKKYEKIINVIFLIFVVLLYINIINYKIYFFITLFFTILITWLNLEEVNQFIYNWFKENKLKNTNKNYNLTLLLFLTTMFLVFQIYTIPYYFINY